MSTFLSGRASIAVIGAGPAGLMAAEVLADAGLGVHVFERMPSVGRKFLMAGKGGLNITHTEPRDAFFARYGERRNALQPMLSAFDADALRGWAHGLGIITFVGSSGRVFPHEMKAAPLLRAWLHRLRGSGVRIHVRHCWQGWNDCGALHFDTPHAERVEAADAVVLAVGGASWPQLGSDGAWVDTLTQRAVSIATLRPANCGFDVEWSDHFAQRYQGQPIKSVVATFTDANGATNQRRGECVVSAAGIEGGLIYALSASLRDSLEATGSAILKLDLAPERSFERLVSELSHPRGSRSVTSHIQSRTGIKGVKLGLLREVLSAEDLAQPVKLTAAIKALPLKLKRPRPLAEAISTAGGVSFDALDEHMMIRSMPGVFCAGEMLDWEAPTGGYLLNACLATGRAAGRGVLAWLNEMHGPPASESGLEPRDDE
jgi:uncharacterized flavoprotein (TIGR03862 family)